MGADLCLNSAFRKHRDRYAPKFDHWVARRDTLHKAGLEVLRQDVPAWLLQGQLQQFQPAVAV